MEQYKRMNNVVNKLIQKKKVSTLTELSNFLSMATNPPKDISENSLSKYCNSTKKIPEDILTLLHELYQVNPDYIRGDSNNMFDDAEIKYSKLQDLIDDWNIVEYENSQRFLYLSFDSDFYNFLLEIGHAEILQKRGMQSYVEEEEKIKRKYNESKKITQEYVLLPRNSFIKIVTDVHEDAEYINNLINFLAFPSNLDDVNAIVSPKHKSDNKNSNKKSK